MLAVGAALPGAELVLATALLLVLVLALPAGLLPAEELVIAPELTDAPELATPAGLLAALATADVLATADGLVAAAPALDVGAIELAAGAIDAVAAPPQAASRLVNIMRAGNKTCVLMRRLRTF